MPEMMAIISQVANLRVAPAGSIGGSLSSADPRFGLAASLIAACTSTVCQNTSESPTAAAGPVTGASSAHPGYLAHGHSFRTLNEVFTAARTNI